MVARRPGPGGVRRPGGAGVAVGRHGEPGRAQLLGAGDADGGAARLERAGREQALVLDQQAWQAERGAETRSREQRRHPLAEGDDVLGRRDGQQLVVAPEVRSAAGDGPRVGADASQVVPRQQRRPVAGTEPLQHGRVVRRAAARALQVVQGAEGHRTITPTVSSTASTRVRSRSESRRWSASGGCRGARPRRGPRAGRASRSPLAGAGQRTCTLRLSSGSFVHRIRPSSWSGDEPAEAAPRLTRCSASRRAAPAREVRADVTQQDLERRTAEVVVRERRLRDRPRCLVSNISRATTCSCSGSIHGSSRSHSAT